MVTAGLLLGALLAAQSAASQPAITFRPRAAVEGRTVMLGQIADLSPLPASLRRRAESLTVAHLPSGRKEVVLDKVRLAERVRTQLPALAPWMASTAPGSVTLQISPGATTEPETPRHCARLAQAVPAGDFLLAGDLVAATCDASAIKAAVRLDQPAGAVRARRDLAVDDLIVAPPAASLALARPGQALRLTTIVGPVAVEREVSLSRPARAGAPVFVRSGSGPVFTAPPPRDLQP